MLYSQFFVDEDRYVIPAQNIVEIIPFIKLKKQPMLPDYARGLLNYHDDAVPVIDLCHLLVQRPCRKKLSTRIILVDGRDNMGHLLRLGFMVEKATEMLAIDEAKFTTASMSNPDSLINGLVTVYQENLLTLVSMEGVYSKLDKRFFSDREMVAEARTE